MAFSSLWGTRRLGLLALPLAGLLAGPARAQVAASFAPPITYSAPGTLGIAVADINGDGQPDVAAVSSGDNTVGVLLGISPANGGGFQPIQQYSTGAGSRPRNVAIADVNLDGVPDLVTANGGTNSAGVLLGKSAASGGGFLPVQQYMTEPQTLYQTGPSDVEVADVNSDGLPDLVVANFTTNSVGVLLGKSAASGGGFQAAQVYSVGSGSLPSDVDVADFNSDGVLDLVTANSNGNGVGVLLGKSAASGGGFQPVQFYSTSRPFSFPYPFRVAVADVNLDGVLDIVSANSNTYSVGVLLGKSVANGGGFQPVQEYVTVNRKPYDIAVADVNGDSLPDVLVTQGTTIVVLLGKSAASGGGFQPLLEVPGGSVNIKVADVNADGRPDLITDGIAVLLNTVGAPTLTTATATNLTASSATLGGTLTGNSSGALTEYGVVYVRGSGTPTISDTKVVVGTSAPATLPSTFAASATGLVANTGYTVRAYATSSLGTGYGNPVSFSTRRPTTATPVLTTPATGSVVSNRRPTLAGTAPAGSTVTLYLAAGGSAAQAQALGTTTATGGSFSFVLTTATVLADGPYSVYATAQGLIEEVSARSSTNTFTVDGTAPTVLSFNRQSPAAALTNAPAVTYRVTFSEPVTGVTGNNFSVSISGALTAASFLTATQVSTSVYDITLSGLSGEGTTYLTFDSNRNIADLAGNALPAIRLVGPTYTIDQTAPTATLSSAAGSATSTAPIPFTATFSEPVTGFATSGLSVRNGTITSALTSAGNAYSFGVTPTADGPVTVSLAANAAQDAAGNGSLAPGPLSVTYTQPTTAPTAPTLTLLSPAAGPVGTRVTLTGTNLTGTTAVSFNGTPASSFVVNSATSLTAVVAAGTTTGPVSVAAPGGTATSATSFVVGAAPITVADAYTTPAGVTLMGNVLSNDLGANLRAILIIRPTHGTLALNPDGTFTYQPAAGYVGADSFIYYACDTGTPLVCGDPATVSLTVTGWRVAPTTVADAYTTPAGVLLAGNVLSNDLGANLRAILIIRPTHGTLALNPDGTFTYQPAAGYLGADSFIYYACDTGATLVCGDPATVSLTVGPPATLAKSAATATRGTAAAASIAPAQALALTGSPNPFAEQLRLSFALPTAQAYTLAVYDAQGRLVQQLASGQAEAGLVQQVEVPTHTYATGLYLVRLTTAMGVQLLKLIRQ